MRKMVAGATAVAATATLLFNVKATVYRMPLHTLETPTTIMTQRGCTGRECDVCSPLLSLSTQIASSQRRQLRR